MLPQFFLAGVFTPIMNLPPLLAIASALSPMRYAVDLLRGVYYAGSPEYSKVVLLSPLTNLVIIGAIFLVCMLVGTRRFVQRERNR